MEIKKKSLNLKKFKIANLSQKLIIGGTNTVNRYETDDYECTIFSIPVITCTSVGQLKSNEVANCERFDLNTQNPQHAVESDGCNP